MDLQELMQQICPAIKLSIQFENSHRLPSRPQATHNMLVQAAKLRLHAQRLTDRTCLAIRLGLLSNLESLRISHLRDENDVQVSSSSASPATPELFTLCLHLSAHRRVQEGRPLLQWPALMLTFQVLLKHSAKNKLDLRRWPGS